MAAGKQTGRRKERDGVVSEKSFEMRHFRILTYAKETGWPLRGLPESLGNENHKKKLQRMQLGVYYPRVRDAKVEILAQILQG